MRAALLLLAALAANSAAAQDVCAKFDDPLAYNACLARQGPAARAVHMGGAPRAVSRPVRMQRRVYPTPRRGRAEMVFPVRK